MRYFLKYTLINSPTEILLGTTKNVLLSTALNSSIDLDKDQYIYHFIHHLHILINYHIHIIQ